MANEYALRCTMCGSTSDIEASVIGDLNQAKYGDAPVHVCEACKARVQYESEQKFK
ncbi:hypothetical protein JJB07_20065 [Tumebacillus sp. ITR2]|uniref:DUF2197 domain-containing protein n=1 Tax=Tumebacillus amylolyticus TaxID=2801339 RepID=A0ABS1JF97_9BACL|nr:hypothetical protein [Tumebacillus amylolyticus]MBL0388895.1 hypothetical protein [Tumebacillus amylolyticus]